MKALKIVGLVIALCFGLFLAMAYKELVALTGNAGFVLATLGGVVAVLSAVIMLVGTWKALNNRVMIR